MQKRQNDRQYEYLLEKKCKILFREAKLMIINAYNEHITKQSRPGKAKRPPDQDEHIRKIKARACVSRLMLILSSSKCVLQFIFRGIYHAKYYGRGGGCLRVKKFKSKKQGTFIPTAASMYGVCAGKKYLRCGKGGGSKCNIYSDT